VQGLIFTRHTPIYIRTRAKSTTKYHQQKLHGQGEEPPEGKNIQGTQKFFTLKIKDLNKMLVQIV
jgi:hypothetical protein